MVLPTLVGPDQVKRNPEIDLAVVVLARVDENEPGGAHRACHSCDSEVSVFRTSAHRSKPVRGRLESDDPLAFATYEAVPLHLFQESAERLLIPCPGLPCRCGIASGSRCAVPIRRMDAKESFLDRIASVESHSTRMKKKTAILAPEWLYLASDLK